MTNLVSIITPAYNAEKFIKSAIDSVKSQTYKDWEMLIVNDCSSDRTESIIIEEMKSDSRIKLISLDVNRGVVYARNKAIDVARGRFIAFLDSDDLWLPDKLEIQITTMISNKWPLTYTNYSLMNEEGELLNKTILTPRKTAYKDLFKGSNMGCLTVVIDRYITGDFKMPNIKHEDYATWLSILEKGHVAFRVDQVLAIYRKTANSLSGNKFKAAKWQWLIYRKYLNLNVLQSIYYFIHYSINGIKKSMRS